MGQFTEITKHFYDKFIDSILFVKMEVLYFLLVISASLEVRAFQCIQIIQGKA